MKSLVVEIFERFSGLFPAGEGCVLKAEEIQTSALLPATNSPVCTLLVKSQYSGTEEAVALVLMTEPSLATDDQRVLDFAARRSRAFKCPFFLTWNLRDTILWCTPKPGTPSSRDSLKKLRDYPDLYEISTAEDQIISELTKLKVIERGREILADLEKLVKDEALELVDIDATYFVGRLLDAVHLLFPLVSESLHLRLQTDISFRKELSAWAVEQSIAGDPADIEFSRSIARQIIYRLLGKVLFYQGLRRSARQLPKLDLEGVESSQVLPTLRFAFAQALKIDYHAVFEESLPDRIQWPSEASLELAALIRDFNTRDFVNLPQDVIGTVFERLIPPEERHGLGQYFTSENLCDLICAFCIRSANDKVLDPTCGTGTFLIRAYDRLRNLGKYNHAELLSQIWGVDISPFPAELATINLFRQRIAEYGNFPRIICKDILRLEPGESFPFPPPKMDINSPEAIEDPVPLFESIVGNFPYVSADKIESREEGYLEFLRERLIHGWFEEFPQLFYYKNNKEQADLERHISAGLHKGCNPENLQLRISTYADLYVYLFFHVSRFLRPGGRIGIVTSNAWLDVNYGYELQQFFLRHFKIVAILESRCEPWFVEASVNTVVTILERCSSAEERNANLVRFVTVKRPLSELVPNDQVVDARYRWKRLAEYVAHVERAAAKYSKTYPLGMISEEDDLFRIRVLRQSEMATDANQEGKTVKWARYLRAPETYFEVINKGPFCILQKIATPKFGSKTRINEFFHVSSEAAGRFGIEPDYLFPLFKSPKETNKIRIDSSTLGLRIFICRKTKSELMKLGHTGALSYIEWGEKQTYSKGKFKGLLWPQGEWLKDREPGWWALPDQETQTGQVFMTWALGDKHVHRFVDRPVVCDNRLYFLQSHKDLSDLLLAATINCSLTALASELSGRVTMGDGVLELKVEEVRDYLNVPDLRRVSVDQKESIVNAFKPLCEREIRSVFEEIKLPDRQEFDSEVLRAVGLDPNKYLKPLYDGLCGLVEDRVKLAQSRGQARKTKSRNAKAENKIAEAVLDEIIPEGPRRFPEEFLSGVAASQNKITVSLPDSPISYTDSPMFRSVHTKDNSFNREVKNKAEGKFLVYAQRAGHKVVSLPEKTVELTRTVANYEKYLRDLRSQLYDAYFQRTLDVKTASRLTQAAFDRFRLPTPEKG